jgi:hypothetical protein
MGSLYPAVWALGRSGSIPAGAIRGRPAIGSGRRGRSNSANGGNELSSDPRAGAQASDPIPGAAGLCAACVHARLVVSGRGSRFVLCERSRTDARFPRYPTLPVVACTGFEARAARSEPI